MQRGKGHERNEQLKKIVTSYKGRCSILTFPFEKWRGRVYVYKTSVDTYLLFSTSVDTNIISLQHDVQ